MSTRLERTQALLCEQDVGVLVVTPGSDLAYLIRHFSHPSERPQMLIVPAEGRPVVVIAGFESRALPDLGDHVDIATYGETESAFDLAALATDHVWWKSAVISDYAWTATLLGLQATFPEAQFATASPLLRELRMIKDVTELSTLRDAATRADSAFDQLLQNPIGGFSESEVGYRLTQLMSEAGLAQAHAIIASGPNGASPHHHTGDRVIEPGDLIVMDFGGTLDGYWADITRTVAVGTPSSRAMAAYEAVRAANEAGSQAVEPGVTAASVDQAARAVIEHAGFGDAFIHRTGHGIGLDGHEEPYIVAGNDLKLRPGMTFSIEPGVYLKGELGIRIEDIVAVTENGVEVFNKTPRDLRVVA